MSRRLSFRERLRLEQRRLEYFNMPQFLRRFAVKSLLPDPFKHKTAQGVDGREVIFLHVPKTNGTSLASAASSIIHW